MNVGTQKLTLILVASVAVLMTTNVGCIGRSGDPVAGSGTSRARASRVSHRDAASKEVVVQQEYIVVQGNSSLPYPHNSSLPYFNGNSSLPIGMYNSTLPGGGLRFANSTLPGYANSTLPGMGNSTLPGMRFRGYRMRSNNSTLPGASFNSTLPATEYGYRIRRGGNPYQNGSTLPN